MSRLAVAMDLGTSGFRAQALDLSSGQILSTAITTRHPLPGQNVIDHLRFAIRRGGALAQRILVESINAVVGSLRVPLQQVVRLAVCGNPVQLSLFQNMEIRDLAYSGGRRKLAQLGVEEPNREGGIAAARDFPLLHLPAECAVVIPPGVKHEVGADALALVMQTGMRDQEGTAVAIDFGTNAEMALFHRGTVFTGSAAAGPAIEGGGLRCGMLAAPGAVCDLVLTGSGYRLTVLDSKLYPADGPLVDLRDADGFLDGVGLKPVGITGTGTVAIVEEGLASGLIKIPRICTADRKLHLGAKIFVSEADLAEAGKAFGAFEAGCMTLCEAAGIAPETISKAYMSGASGTYVDVIKAQKLGLIPPRVKEVYQFGNTSLGLARDLAIHPERLTEITALAGELRKNHCLFASSGTFKKIYILEFSRWTEGMPTTEYRRFLRKYGLPDLPPLDSSPKIHRVVERDIQDLGSFGLVTIEDIGSVTRKILGRRDA